METTSAAEAVRVSGRPDCGAAGARLAELFAAHGTTVLGLCRLLLRQREEAEDAVQQTFLAAYRSLLGGTEPRYPAAWLATIARNECRARARQRMREPLAEPDPESRLPDPVSAAADRADLGELWRAIGELPEQQREALLLREFSGLSYAELAEALDVSEPAVESLLFRARRGLRGRLELVYGSLGSVAPPAALREALARLGGGMPDPGAAGAFAKIASAPLMAKLAAGTVAVVVAGGGVVAVERHATRHARPPAPKPSAPVTGAGADVAAADPAAERVATPAPRPARAQGARPGVLRAALPARRAAVAPAASSVSVSQPVAPTPATVQSTVGSGGPGPTSSTPSASAAPTVSPTQPAATVTAGGSGPSTVAGGGEGVAGTSPESGDSSSSGPGGDDGESAAGTEGSDDGASGSAESETSGSSTGSSSDSTETSGDSTVEGDRQEKDAVSGGSDSGSGGDTAEHDGTGGGGDSASSPSS